MKNQNADNVEEIFRAAFMIWETYTCLTFQQVNNPIDADIQIKFAR